MTTIEQVTPVDVSGVFAEPGISQSVQIFPPPASVESENEQSGSAPGMFNWKNPKLILLAALAIAVLWKLYRRK